MAVLTFLMESKEKKKRKNKNRERFLMYLKEKKERNKKKDIASSGVTRGGGMPGRPRSPKKNNVTITKIYTVGDAFFFKILRLCPVTDKFLVTPLFMSIIASLSLMRKTVKRIDFVRRYERDQE